MGGTCGTYGGQKRNTLGIWRTNFTGRDHPEDLGVDERIILKWIESTWTRLIWLRTGTSDKTIVNAVI
jgi:hypothetical protein